MQDTAINQGLFRLISFLLFAPLLIRNEYIFIIYSVSRIIMVNAINVFKVKQKNKRLSYIYGKKFLCFLRKMKSGLQMKR